MDSFRSKLYHHVWFQFCCRFICPPSPLNLSETSNFHFKVSFLFLSNYRSLLFLSLIGSTRSLHRHLLVPPSPFFRPSVFNLPLNPTALPSPVFAYFPSGPRGFPFKTIPKKTSKTNCETVEKSWELCSCDDLTFEYWSEMIKILLKTK